MTDRRSVRWIPAMMVAFMTAGAIPSSAQVPPRFYWKSLVGGRAVPVIGMSMSGNANPVDPAYNVTPDASFEATVALAGYAQTFTLFDRSATAAMLVPMGRLSGGAAIAGRTFGEQASGFGDPLLEMVVDKEQNSYTSVPVPDTIDATLDALRERTGMVIPLTDFVYEDVYGRLMESVQRGVYLGIHDVSDIACHHLSFEQATIDWQLWIDAGEEPLPRKLVIVYKTEDEVPQYTVTIGNWNLNTDVPEELFPFEPPEGASRIEFPSVQEALMKEQKP